MVEKDVNKKLVTDIARICRIADSWPAAMAEEGRELPMTWEARTEWIRGQLNNGNEQIFIDHINEILTDSAAEDKIRGILDKAYLTNTRTLLKYRIDNAGNNEEIPHIKTGKLSSEEISSIKDLISDYGSTVLNYSILEYYDDIDTLQEALCKILDTKVSILVYERSEPVIYREKVPYLGHKIWACTQLMPLIMLSIE